MKVKLEYVWLDGYDPEPNLRSKVKIVESQDGYYFEAPEWGFDGSSTMQAEGNSSDCYLKPVRIYKKRNDGKEQYPTAYVLCEVYNKDGNPHPSNYRNQLGEEDIDFWVGFEQEYFIRSGHNEPILGFHFFPEKVDPQGKYYCGVGGHISGREVSNLHLNMCLDYGIQIEGTNAEVALGQWEYQIFAKGKIKAADDLWMSRYFLYKIAEEIGYQIEFHPKPIIEGEWNGSGLHTNFSNTYMREIGGVRYFNMIFDVLGKRQKIHIENYGSDNHLRLTGKFETQSIHKFTWGVSDRGSSIRIPKITGDTWKGYLEDRRPGSNADPYKVIKVLSESLKMVDQEM